VVEEIWLDGRYGERLDAAKITDSLYATYKRVLNLWIMRAEDRVSIAKALAWTPAVFGKDPGEPCGFVERIGFSQTGARVEWSRSWFDPDEAHYVQRLK
ncbi:MAG: UTRA domain-containing protein, partial [Pseudomonadota bacterium]